MKEISLDIAVVLIIGIGSLFVLIGFMISFIFTFKQKQQANLKEKAQLHAQYQQEIFQAQLEIQNQTLQHIGGELHDNIGQLLSVARLQLNMLEEDEAYTPQKLHEVNDVIGKTIAEIRALTKGLDGGFVKDFGLVESLSHELQRVRNTGKFETQMEIEGEPYRLEDQKEMVLFRVVQEILNNIIKHAAAKRIKATLHYAPTKFSLRVEDDGKGFDYETILKNPMNESGAGLRNIQRRTELLGGKCTYQTALGQGTKIAIELPVTPNSMSE